jgi:hypothetical protein
VSQVALTVTYQWYVSGTHLVLPSRVKASTPPEGKAVPLNIQGTCSHPLLLNRHHTLRTFASVPTSSLEVLECSTTSILWVTVVNVPKTVQDLVFSSAIFLSKELSNSESG